MSLRKIYSAANEAAGLSAIVYRDAEWGEYRVRHYSNGVLNAAADYHTDDKAEAIDHANMACRAVNAFAYADDNQRAFRSWFDSLPADTLRYYAIAYSKGELNVLAVLRNGAQSAGWFDSFIDCLLDSQAEAA